MRCVVFCSGNTMNPQGSHILDGIVAQLVEQLSDKQSVGGSNPSINVKVGPAVR